MWVAPLVTSVGLEHQGGCLAPTFEVPVICIAAPPAETYRIRARQAEGDGRQTEQVLLTAGDRQIVYTPARNGLHGAGAVADVEVEVPRTIEAPKCGGRRDCDALARPNGDRRWRHEEREGCGGYIDGS